MQIYDEGLIKSKSQFSNSYNKQLRFYSLFQMAEYILKKNNYENFIECGCWKGHSSYCVSLILQKYNFNKKFIIFDSFEGGLSNKDPLDVNNKRFIQNKSNRNNQIKYFSSSYEEVLALLNPYKFIEINKSWIPKKFELIKDLKFSFIHIDLDLYKPTLETLNFFYPKLVDGGVIICEDYNCSDFPGAKIAIDDFLSKNNVNFFYEVPFGSCIIIK